MDKFIETLKGIFSNIAKIPFADILDKIGEFVTKVLTKVTEIFDIVGAKVKEIIDSFKNR